MSWALYVFSFLCGFFGGCLAMMTAFVLGEMAEKRERERQDK